MIDLKQCSLGIELGSTRIKAVLVGDTCKPVAQGDFTWENRLENGVWTYPLEEVWQGVQAAYAALAADVLVKCGQPLTTVGCIGVSAMMHGYLAFDAAGKLLVPFRTWRNTMTGAAAEELTAAFGFNIPQRWSIAHLYQAMLNREPHLPQLDFFTTLAGYVHWQLTGRKVLGEGDASGMFPIDSATGGYDAAMLAKFNVLADKQGCPVDLVKLLPAVLPAGEDAGMLTVEGAKRLDPTGTLQPGIPFCPPEGDAGTGMVATNSVAPRTGNVSAGTSIFAMVVLEKPLSRVYPEIDMVTTPDGAAVAMVHCNNCTSDLTPGSICWPRARHCAGQTSTKVRCLPSCSTNRCTVRLTAAASRPSTTFPARASPTWTRAFPCCCAARTVRLRWPTLCAPTSILPLPRWRWGWKFCARKMWL